jgi:replication-associated recombination protein RarA
MEDHDYFDGLVQLATNELTYPDPYSLITIERTSKLDLLFHLLTHLTTSIVICGPKGIGKTTLLKALQELKTSWEYCLLAATPELSEESIESIFVDCANNKNTILIIDDAGLLSPGLITIILNNTASNDHLSVIFALTHDEIYLKNSSDPLINECSVIEIPPLSEKQCGDFIQYLAKNPNIRGNVNNLDDTTIAAIYRDTHGIPGKIIGTLPDIKRQAIPDRTLTWLILSVVLLVTAALSIQWLGSNNWISLNRITVSNQTTPENSP